MSDTLYLFHRTMRIEDARNYANAADGYGAGFDPKIAARTRRVEVWAPQDRSNGSDFLEFRAFDDDGLLIATKRTNGHWH